MHLHMHIYIYVYIHLCFHLIVCTCLGLCITLGWRWLFPLASSEAPSQEHEAAELRWSERRLARQDGERHMGGCQNYGPFLVP